MNLRHSAGVYLFHNRDIYKSSASAHGLYEPDGSWDISPIQKLQRDSLKYGQISLGFMTEWSYEYCYRMFTHHSLQADDPIQNPWFYSLE